MEYQLITPRIPDKTNFTPVEQVFLNRGMSLLDIEHYFNTSKDDVLNPELLDNMQQGAEMLIKHLVAGDKIFI